MVVRLFRRTRKIGEEETSLGRNRSLHYRLLQERKTIGLKRKRLEWLVRLSFQTPNRNQTTEIWLDLPYPRNTKKKPDDKRMSFFLDKCRSLLMNRFKDMMPGEAAAMALYAAKGERIPRRGEVGLDSSRIEEFETSGYVMSGNRNKKMNAVRLRKENQVISAEEKRAILNLQKEERMKKEGAIISQVSVGVLSVAMY